MNKRQKKKIYSSEELIRFLQQFHLKNNRVPNTRELDSTSGYPSAGVFRRAFGSLKKAFDEAEIDVGSQFRLYYSESDLINYLIKYVSEFKELPTVRDMDNAEEYPSATAFRLKFGSLRKALEAANLRIPENYRKNYSEDELLHSLQKYIKEFGNIPTVEQMDKTVGYPSASTFRYRFGSLRKALIKLDINLPDSYYVSYKREELLELLREYYHNFGYPTSKGLDENKYYPSSRTYLRRFGTFRKALIAAGMQVPEYTFNIFTNKELINLLKRYSKEYGLPTYDGITQTKGYPSASVYVSRFGSWQETLIKAGFDLPEDRLRRFNKITLSDNEILEHLRYHTWLKLIQKGRKGLHFCSLLVHHEIDEIKDLPVTQVLFRRFGGVKEAYKRLGMDYDVINKKLAKQYMISQFKKLAKYIARTPRLPDLIEYDWYTGISLIAWKNHFGGINDIQIECGFEPIYSRVFRTREKLLSDLHWVKEQLGGQTPTKDDLLQYRENIAHPTTYINEFGSYLNALKLAGLEPARYKYTEKGTLYRSKYEYRFYTMLENKGIDYSVGYYRDYIPELKGRRFTFDAVIWIRNRRYFVELFCVINNLGNYDKKTKFKIDICNKYDIPLIEFYPKEFVLNNSEEKLYKLLFKKIALLS